MRTRTRTRTRTRRVAALVAAAVVGVPAAWTATASPAMAAGDTYGTCGGTLTRFGSTLDCRDGSFYDRSRDGSYDEIFAIRTDRVVVHASKGHPWVVVSDGSADRVYSTFRLADGRRTVCVQVSRSGSLYESVRNPNGWSSFHLGCHGYG